MENAAGAAPAACARPRPAYIRGVSAAGAPAARPLREADMGMVVLIVVALLALIVIGYLVGIFNQLIAVRVNVDKSWSNIEVLEKQRYDEIPRLVKVCEGYMQYERDTLEKVIAARTRYLAAPGPAAKAEAGSDMAAALKSLFAVVENYPELKANQNFIQLQSRITSLE